MFVAILHTDRLSWAINYLLEDLIFNIMMLSFQFMCLLALISDGLIL